MKKLKSICLFLLIFFYIFGPVFRQIGNWFDFIFFTSFVLTIYGYFFLKLNIPKYFTMFYFIIVVFAYLLVSINFYPFTTNQDIFRMVLIPIRILFTLYGGFVIVNLSIFIFPKTYFVNLLYFIFLSVLVHAIIMSLQFYSQSFKDFIYYYTSTGESRGNNEYDFRMGGLTGSFGDSILSVVQSLGIIFIPWISKYVNIYKKILLYFGGLLIFYSILICGRSGIWSTLFFLPLSYILSSDFKGVVFWIKFFLNSLILILIFILIVILFDRIENGSQLYYALKRSLDTFIDYKDTGTFDDHTVQTISTFILFPTDIIVFLFGDGEHMVNTQFSRTLDSDIGYIRNFWSMGIIVASMFWAPIVYYTLVSGKLINKYKSAALLFCLSLIMLIFHTKENFLYVRMFHSIYSIVLFSMYITVKKAHYN